jgi:hypothetical protein
MALEDGKGVGVVVHRVCMCVGGGEGNERGVRSEEKAINREWVTQAQVGGVQWNDSCMGLTDDMGTWCPGLEDPWFSVRLG